jgi:hypothetical protein
VSPNECDDYELNYSTPPLLLPSDLLAASPATNEAFTAQAYLEACKLLAKSPYQKKRQRVARKEPKQTKEAKSKKGQEELAGPSSSYLVPSTSKASTAKSPESTTNASDILSNMFSMARNTGGVIKANEIGIESIKELKPVFHADIEENMGELKTTAGTSDTTIDKYVLSSSNSVDSEPKIYETVYDNEQRYIL